MGGVIILDYLVLNYTILMRLESRVPSISLNYLSNTSRKAVYQSSNVIWGIWPHSSLSASANSCLLDVWFGIGRKGSLQHVPCMIDGIQIGGLSWPVHSFDSLFLKVGRHDACAVWCRITVHQDELLPNCTGVGNLKDTKISPCNTNR